MAEIGLVGRVESRDFLLRALGDGAQVAVVLGGPGAGKTALLAAVAGGQREQGVRVVEVTGQPLEAGLAFAALVELLSNLEPGAPRSGVRMDELALVSSDPLRQRLEVLRRVEELVRRSGPRSCVDDAQWIDASSLSVLAFVANRISGSSVAMVVAARGEVAPPGFAAHPVVPPPTPRQPPVPAGPAAHRSRPGRLADGGHRDRVDGQPAGPPRARPRGRVRRHHPDRHVAPHARAARAGLRGRAARPARRDPDASWSWPPPAPTTWAP